MQKHCPPHPHSHTLKRRCCNRKQSSHKPLDCSLSVAYMLVTSISNRWISLDNSICCQSEIETADQKISLTHSALLTLKLLINFTIAPSHSTLTLTQSHKSNGRTTSRVPFFKTLARLGHDLNNAPRLLPPPPHNQGRHLNHYTTKAVTDPKSLLTTSSHHKSLRCAPHAGLGAEWGSLWPGEGQRRTQGQTVCCSGLTALSDASTTQIAAIPNQRLSLQITAAAYFVGTERTYLHGMNTLLHFESSRPEWCISSMIYSRDTPFWLETLDLFKDSFHAVTINECCTVPCKHMPSLCTDFTLKYR